MRTTYNLIAGQSLERLAALSDGVFAIAMTLLVLDLHVPLSEGIHTEHYLWRQLVKLSPNLVALVLSFLTLGIFWVGQQTQLNHLARGDRNLAWIHLVFLLDVSLMPFSTGLLARFITYRLALLVYWFNLLLLGVALFAGWRYASRAGLLKGDVTDERRAAIEHRIVVYQALYAAGALLCFVSTYLSIAVIGLVLLNSVLAPRTRLLARL
jgi:uncharacterized membrane protein